MGTLYLVRHGQASFGAADYDRLSELGARQCHALGRWFAARGVRFDAVLRGSLRRHRESLQALAEGHGAVPEADVRPALNEYDSEAVVRAVHPGPLGPADTPEAYRHHFRLLREGLLAWMDARTAPAGMPSYADFVAGIDAVLAHVRTLPADATVLAVSSGGPIATALGRVLGTAARVTIDLNYRLRNSALTELHFSASRHVLVGFNHLPHLDDPALAAWVTHT